MPAARVRAWAAVAARTGVAAWAGAAAVGLVVAGCSAPVATGPTATGPTATAPTAGVSTSSSGSTATATTGIPSSGGPSATTGPPTDGPTRDVATGLRVPWSVVVLPGSDVLVGERDTARVWRVRPSGERVDLGRVPDVVPGGEGGLLGLAIGPGDGSALYAYLTAASDNRVVVLPLGQAGLGAPRTVLSGIPKANVHNGGRIAFGPDGMLYVGTGDAGQRESAQDLGSLGGKILRVTAQGLPAPGNPYAGSRVWSWGHRNVQGFAWDRAGRMWASEFGQDTWDELNLVRPGGNYGWPAVEGIAGRDGFVDPVRQWRPADASPSGLAVGPDGAVYVAGLRGQSLWRVGVRADGSTDEPVRLLAGRYGRLRDVLVGPDGRLWVVSNNTARGAPRPGDDRVVSVANGDLG